MSSLPTFRTRAVATVTGNKTLTAADSGIVQNVVVANGSSVTVTLPSTALGLSFIIRNGSNNGDVLINVTPQAADGITGLGFTAAASKGAVITAATAQAGDELALVGTGTAGVTAYVVQNAVGAWLRQA